MSKITLETIAESIGERQWTLPMEQKYQTLDTQLEFKCPKGHSVYANWRTMRKRLEKPDYECPICAEDRVLAAQKQMTHALEDEHIPKKAGTRILGLDQATHTTGYCIIEGSTILKIGTFEAGTSRDEIERSTRVKYWMLSMISNWKIDYVCLEGIQYEHNNPQLFATLARLQGILMASLYKHQVEYEVVPVATWRNYNGIKGKSRTDRKMAMQNVISKECNLQLTDDVCDAVGIARYAAAARSNAMKMEEW